MIKVCKFGGTSMASANSIIRVADIIMSDKDRKCIVLSAPGLRDVADTKVTDQLYKAYNNPIAWKIVSDRLQTIVDELQIEFDLNSELEQIFCDIANGANQDYVVSRGEYLVSKLVSRLIGYRFIDAKDIVMVDQTGKIDLVQTRRQVKELIHPHINKGVVVPGFYGTYNNSIRLLGRGGSDITGAVLSYALPAAEYENWTDVDGIHVFDPRIGHSRPNKTMSYYQVVTLAQAGVNVLHPDSCVIAAIDSIPITIKNTFNSCASGTRIVANTHREHKVLSVSSTSNMTTVVLSKLSTSDTLLQDLMRLVDRYNVKVVNMVLDNNCVSLTMPISNQYNPKHFKRALTKQLNHISCKIYNTALIKIVGKNMLCQALQELSIYNVQIVSSFQSKDVSNILILPKDRKRAMDILYKKFVVA